MTHGTLVFIFTGNYSTGRESANTTYD